MRKQVIVTIIFTVTIFSSFCQPNFAIDTILLPGQYIQKVSASRSSDVWVIEDTSSRNIYRIDENLSIYNHSTPFQTATNSIFTAILNNDVNNTLVGTKKDFVFHWNKGNISKLNTLNGLTDSTINSIVGYPKVLYEQNKYIGISANTSNKFYTTDYLNFTLVGGGNPQAKFLEYGRYSSIYTTSIIKYSLTKITLSNGDDWVECGTDWSGWAWGSGLNWRNINTATVFSNYWDYNPRILVGSDNSLIANHNSTFTTYLSGFRINKVVKYSYNSPFALVASDSGLYIFDISLPTKAYKASFLGNKFKANDVDISPDGCVWLATDMGLVRLKNLNCDNYKQDFTISDSTLMIGDGCEIKFNTGCLGCTKNWNWSFGDGTNSTASNPSHIYNQSGAYTVNLISGNGTCLDTVTKNISILICCDSSKYNLANFPKDTSICNNGYLDAGNCINCDYQWSTGATTQTINVNAPGIYWIKLQNEGGCVSHDTINVSVSSTPSVSFSGLLNNYCANSSSSILTGLPSGGIFSGSGILGNSFDPTIALIGTDTIKYTYTDTNGCSNSSLQTVTVLPLPIVSLTGLANNYCVNASPVNLNGSPSGGIFSGKGISGNLFNQSIAGIGTHAIIYSYTDGNSCSNADTQQVIVNPLPIASFTGLSSNYCITDSSVNLTGSPSGGAFIGSGISGNTFTPSVAGAGTISITYSYVDANGCSDTSIQMVSVVPLPSVSISGTTTICAGETVTLTASGVGNFIWSNGNTTNAINIAPTSITTYSVTASNFCGIASDAIIVTVNPLPITTTSNDTSILYGNSANLFATGGTSYSWSPASGLSCTSCSNPIATPQSTTTYLVTITDANGCSVTEQITITVDNNFEIFVPDIFSPNGDGQNDILYVRGTGIKELSFIIYDRLGEKIFSTNDITKGWDGTYKGSLLNNAVFVYYISATLINDKKIKTKGDVTLIK